MLSKNLIQSLQNLKIKTDKVLEKINIQDYLQKIGVGIKRASVTGIAMVVLAGSPLAAKDDSYKSKFNESNKIEYNVKNINDEEKNKFVKAFNDSLRNKNTYATNNFSKNIMEPIKNLF
jgi:hypothetical protein